jgi:hypothetical protein
MEILVGIVIAVGFFVIRKAMQFANFKSELMHAMAQQGMSYVEANNLYTIHANLVSKLHADGLDVRSIAVGLASNGKTNEEKVMANIKDISDLFTNMTNEMRTNKSYIGKNIFNVMEFISLFAACIASVKKHFDASPENGSYANEFVNALNIDDFETMTESKEKILAMIHQLPADEASEFMFHFFWPQLHGKLREA